MSMISFSAANAGLERSSKSKPQSLSYNADFYNTTHTYLGIHFENDSCSFVGTKLCQNIYKYWQQFNQSVLDDNNSNTKRH